jgi:hypothetical protein
MSGDSRDELCEIHDALTRYRLRDEVTAETVADAVADGLSLYARICRCNAVLAERHGLTSDVLDRPQAESLVAAYRTWHERTRNVMAAVEAYRDAMPPAAPSCGDSSWGDPSRAAPANVPGADVLGRYCREAGLLSWDIVRIVASVSAAKEGRAIPLGKAADEFRRTHYPTGA